MFDLARIRLGSGLGPGSDCSHQPVSKAIFIQVRFWWLQNRLVVETSCFLKRFGFVPAKPQA